MLYIICLNPWHLTIGTYIVQMLCENKEMKIGAQKDEKSKIAKIDEVENKK